VAVRTHDIAHGGFGKNPLDAGSADHPGHADPFVGSFAMIEIHGARRETLATVGASHPPEVVEHPRVQGPAASPLFEAPRSPNSLPVARPLLVLSSGPDSVTDRADDLALRNLGEEAVARASKRRRARQAK
jgi:hypothetical protein